MENLITCKTLEVHEIKTLKENLEIGNYLECLKILGLEKNDFMEMTISDFNTFLEDVLENNPNIKEFNFNPLLENLLKPFLNVLYTVKF